MIKSFKHKGLEKFFNEGTCDGTTAGIQAAHIERLKKQLSVLNQAKSVEDMRVPGWELHELKGKSKGVWSVKVNGNYRMTFKSDNNGNFLIVDYQDYH